MSFSPSDGRAAPKLILPWNEFCDLLEGASWDQACSQWSFDQLSDERRLALPILARRFTESRQFLLSDGVDSATPLEVFWLQCRLFAGLCSQLLAFYQQHHRPHLGIGPSRIQVALPKVADPFLPARWNFSVESVEGMDMAVPFVHETIPPAFQGQLFQPPHSLDTCFKPPEMRDWPLGKKEEFTVLVRSMERIRKPEHVPAEVTGMFQLHIASDTMTGSSFSAQDVFCIQLLLPQSGHVPATIWGTRQESSERGIVVRGQSEPMSHACWEQLEMAKDTAFLHAPVTFFRSFQHSCDWYSLGLLLFQTVLGRDDETLARLERCLPTLIRGSLLLAKQDAEQPHGNGPDRIRLLFDEQGTLFSSKRGRQSHQKFSKDDSEIPPYLWYAVLKLGLALMARRPVSGLSQDEAPDPIAELNGVLRRIQQIGEWMRLELFHPQERRREVLRACHKMRQEIASIGS